MLGPRSHLVTCLIKSNEKFKLITEHGDVGICFVSCQILNYNLMSWHCIEYQNEERKMWLSEKRSANGVYSIIARRAFLWETSKKWCPSVCLFVCPSVCLFVCPDFSGKSSVAYSERDINFGFIYLGKISRSEKSKNQNAFRYLAIVTTSIFLKKKIKNVLRSKYDLKIRNFHNWVHIHSVKTTNIQLFADENHDPHHINGKRLPHKTDKSP